MAELEQAYEELADQVTGQGSSYRIREQTAAVTHSLVCSLEMRWILREQWDEVS
jgi:hypothetical protein